MRRIAAFAALLFLIAAAPAPDPAQTAQEEAQIAFALQRGRLLFEIDRAAWVGTDDALPLLQGASREGLAGYLVERDGPGFAVTFFGGPEAAPVAFYRGVVRDRRVESREVFSPGARPPLSAAQRRLAAVRRMANGLGRRPCGNMPFNTAAIPPETPDGPIDLYLLTPQTQDRAWPLGGHYRATINADGSVASSRAFTNSCLTMSQPPGAVAMVVSHLLDPVPTEIHVFTALTSGQTVYVAIRGRVYEVSGNSIGLVDRGPARPGN